MDIETKKKGLLLGIITGDALGSPLDGMSRGHISSAFKRIGTYLDTAAALKNRPDLWKKPGAYTSLSQLAVLALFSVSRKRRGTLDDFRGLIRTAPEAGDSPYGIFRHPGTMERIFLDRVRGRAPSSADDAFHAPTARAAVISAPMAFSDSSLHELIACQLLLLRELTMDPLSMAGSLIFTSVLRRNLRGGSPPSDPVAAAGEEAREIHRAIGENPAMVFDLKINPDTLGDAAGEYLSLLRDLTGTQARSAAGPLICRNVNRKLKTPVTRATIDHPLAIIPYALVLARESMPSPAEALVTAAREGGAAGVLCALTGALSGSLFGTGGIPDMLLHDLMNKKRILALAESASLGRVTEAQAMDFLVNEVSLTMKESEERQARMKHMKAKPKKPKNRQDRESALTKHVVESWTKRDKAKWKKIRDK